MNETLEAMARALFQSWFVDFDPVRAKMEGRDTGLPPDLATLFPDRLVDSELGLIPEGWGVRALGEVFDLTMGQSPPGNTYNDKGEGLPFFQGRTGLWLSLPGAQEVLYLANSRRPARGYAGQRPGTGRRHQHGVGDELHWARRCSPAPSVRVRFVHVLCDLDRPAESTGIRAHGNGVRSYHQEAVRSPAGD